MKSTLFTLALLACAVVSAEDWKPLFNADLSNADYNPAVWSVDAQNVLSANSDSAIWTHDEYENFELYVEFKTDDHTNSGVVIYCCNKENWIPNSVEIQINDDSKAIAEGAAPQKSSCGAIYGHVAPSKLLVKKPGEWNTMIIKAVGKNLEVTLNGEKVSEMDMSLWTSAKKNPDGSDIPAWLSTPFSEIVPKGFVGFQGKHGKSCIYFRNLKIRPAK
ncbi:MAG: DUF1080 domain-containing protein [Planctomycetia bacterium]|nr:DUF1080 domain-containing protein [Planctomycetia bacterium]